MKEPLLNSDQKSENTFPQQNAPSDLARYYTGIDWGALILRLLEKIHWILLVAILCAAGTGLYVKTRVKPVYQATSKIYIAGSETTISLSDLQLGSSLAIDYQEAFKIWHVHEMVDERLGLDYSYSKLAGMVSVSNPSGSHLLYINIKSTIPEEAKQLADTYAEVVQEFIADKMELRKPQVLELAQVPTRPISPDLRGSIIKAFAVGFFLSAGLFLFVYLLDDKIRTGEDVEKATGLATLGLVPKQQEQKKQEAAARSEQLPLPERVAVIQKDLALDYAGNESINMICSAITFTGKNIKRIAVTSHDAGNGKTFVSIRIAASMAERGKKVLFIDADMRKSVLISHYQIKNTQEGLAHLLSGQCGIEQAIYPTNLPNLYLLPIGENVKTPLPLLTSPDFEQLMNYVCQLFDLVVVDTPPLGMVIDAAEIAKRCDGSLLVLMHDKQTKGTLQYMQRIIEQTRTPIIGCVINDVVVKGLYKRHYYYQYGGAYKSEYYSSDSGGNAKDNKRWFRLGGRKK